MAELLELLNRNGVEYLVVGAHAVNAYTEPRSTKDLDLWVNRTTDNVQRVFKALREFGAPLFGETEKTFVENDKFLIIGIEPNRIDILKDIQGVAFTSVWENRRVIAVHGISINLPSPTDLLAAKVAAGRHQDLADAEKLRTAIALERRGEQGKVQQADQEIDLEPEIER